MEKLSAGKSVAVTDALLRQLADYEELALKRRLVFKRRMATYEDLRHEWLGCHRCLSQRRIVDRHIPPAEQGLPLFSNNFSQLGFDGNAVPWILGKKELSHAIVSHGRKLEPKADGLRNQKIMRHLDQYSSAITCVRLTAHRAAMIQINQYLQCIADQLMRLFAFHVHDETKAAGVVFKLRIVKALFQGC